MHQGQSDNNRRAPSRAPLPEPTTPSSNLFSLVFTGYPLADGGKGSAPERRGIGFRGDLFSCMYVLGYPDFNSLMALFIDGISNILNAGMSHLYSTIVVGRYLDRFVRFYSLQPHALSTPEAKEEKFVILFISHALSIQKPPLDKCYFYSLSSITCRFILQRKPTCLYILCSAVRTLIWMYTYK